jgi:hypothetical protein
MTNTLKRRLARMEQAMGTVTMDVFGVIRFISPDGSEALDPEEAAILDKHEEKLRRMDGHGGVKTLLRTKGNAQSLLAGGDLVE